jgi:heme-degrading monooxygenase HmoA
MFMRLFHLKAKSDKIGVLISFYDAIVIPELQKIDGCLFAGLLQSNTDITEGISLTLWDTNQHAESYELSGLFEKLLDQAKPFLAESTEWKVQLSENLELEYKPEGDEPELKHFNVTVHERVKEELFGQHSKMYIRIVSHILQKDKIKEFRDIFVDQIIPTLRETKGCRYSYLIESMQQENEVISLSIWDSKEDALAYEKGGMFDKLINILRPTFSQFYQWKMALEKDPAKKVSTTDDLKVTHYQVVTGKNLRNSFPENR